MAFIVTKEGKRSCLTGQMAAAQQSSKVCSSSHWAISNGNSISVLSKKICALSGAKQEFTYDGTEHCPTVSADGIQIGDDVQLNVTGATSHAGTHTATVTLDGADAAKYRIFGSNSIQYTILPASPAVQFTATVQEDDTVNLYAVVSGLADDTLTGSVEFKKDGETICSSELNGNIASSTYSVSEPGTHVFAATYIPSENSNYSSPPVHHKPLMYQNKIKAL